MAQRSKRFRLVLEILDGYDSAKEVLKDLGVLGPLATLVAAVATYLWAASQNISAPTRAVLVATVLVLGIVLLFVWRLWAQVRPVALPEDLARTHISHLSFRIVDMARDDFVIRNRTFEDCTIYGPAVLVMPGGSSGLLQECLFHVSNATEMFLDVGSAPAITGVIVLEGCVMRRCRLIRIAFAGPQELLRKLQAEIPSNQRSSP